MATFDISLGSGTPATPTTNPGDKVTWTNTLSVTVTLTLPTCLSPSNVTQISISANSTYGTTYTVNGGSKGSYSYNYSYPPSQTVQSGTIDVS